MSKKILVTSTDLMMIQFLVPHIINLSENTEKVFVECGRIDLITTDTGYKETAPEILDYLPNGKMTIIENAGHMLNMEQPKAFNAALREFLKQ